MLLFVGHTNIGISEKVSAKSNNISQANTLLLNYATWSDSGHAILITIILRRGQKKSTIVKYKSIIAKKPLAAWYDMHQHFNNRLIMRVFAYKYLNHFRDFDLVITATGHLISLSNRSPQPGDKEYALKLAEESVSYGFALQQQQPDSFKEETPKVFESIITPVLDHFGLQLFYSKANIIKKR
ncbi:hypothetical protein BC941DRAFT_475523 [Chlamydoabsidia padenii]|nr:hypothetical protein BC941DRAFT_475523 [Chlamydoabsidia padenii]